MENKRPRILEKETGKSSEVYAYYIKEPEISSEERLL